MIEDWPLQLEMPVGVDSKNDFTAFRDAFKLERPYGLSGSPESGFFLATSLRLSTVPTDPGALFHAVIGSLVRFHPATEQSSAFLEVKPLPFELAQLGSRLRNSPLPASFFYGNIELNSSRQFAGDILRARGVKEEDLEERLDRYMAGDLWLLVKAGQALGRGTIDPNLAGRRRLDFSVTDKNGTFLNPAHFFFQWPIVNLSLENHPLITVLRPLQHALVFPAKGRVLFVRRNSATPTPPYDELDKAATNINDALAHAESGDIVLVADNALYNEKLFLPNGVTLTSLGAVGQMNRIQESPPNYPIVSDRNSLASAISIESPGEAPTHVSGFRITGGVRPDTRVIGAGGGIKIRNCLNVEIAYNDIHDNVAISGGGIAVVGCRNISIVGNLIHNNLAMDALGFRGQGGGIYVDVDTSQVVIDDNGIYENSADNFGGGVAVFGQGVAVARSAKVKIVRNLIGGPSDHGNRVNKNRLPIFDSAILDNPQGGAGGIGVYDCFVEILQNKIHHNEANSGGGIEFYVNGGGNVIGNEIDNNFTRQEPAGGDGGGIAVNPTSLTASSADAHRTVLIRNNEIRGNQAADDGGGVYGTIKSILKIEDCNILFNSARNNGGGVRVSTGSRLTMTDTKILNNQANLEDDPLAKRNSGGGGVAMRNSLAEIERCTIALNTTVEFAGGGIYLATFEEEGGLPTMTFDDLLTGPLRFTRAELILKDCEITNNVASGPLGAGAGLYVPYDKYDVHIQILNTTLSPNTASHSDPAKARNVVLQDVSLIKDPLQNDTTLPPLTPLVEFETVLEP